MGIRAVLGKQFAMAAHPVATLIQTMVPADKLARHTPLMQENVSRLGFGPVVTKCFAGVALMVGNRRTIRTTSVNANCNRVLPT